jgi:hypothetical protein
MHDVTLNKVSIIAKMFAEIKENSTFLEKSKSQVSTVRYTQIKNVFMKLS